MDKKGFKSSSYVCWAVEELCDFIQTSVPYDKDFSINTLIDLTEEFRDIMNNLYLLNCKNTMFLIAEELSEDFIDILKSMK